MKTIDANGAWQRLRLGILATGLALAWPASVLAEQVKDYRLQPSAGEATIGQSVEFVVSRAANGETCAVQIDYGDGSSKSLRLEAGQKRASDTHVYARTGNYGVTLDGKVQFRGLKTALACAVDKITLQYPVRGKQTVRAETVAQASPATPTATRTLAEPAGRSASAPGPSRIPPDWHRPDAESVREKADPVSANDRSSTLKASRQADGALFFRGKLQGTPVRFSHRGPVGKGTWHIYSGTPGDRIRTVLSDTGTLQEILAMDTGLRLTVRYVGRERVEYRNYSDKGKFLYGAVLYLMDSKWMQGLMFTEAFAGYDSLVNVSDVTAQVTQGLSRADKPAGRSGKTGWRPSHGFSLISTAYAQEVALGTQAMAQAVLEEAQSIYFYGVVAVLGGAAATLGPAKAGAAITTSLGVVVEGAAVALASPVVAGVIVGSIAHNNRDRIREELRGAREHITEKLKGPFAFFGALMNGQREEIHITDAAASQEDIREYGELSSPTRYSTTPAPVAPKPIPAWSAISPTLITPSSIRASLAKPLPPPPLRQVFLRAPRNFRAVQTGDLAYRLSWGQSDGATGYHIHQKKDAPSSVSAGHYIQSKTQLPLLVTEGRERTTHQSRVGAAGTYCWTVSAIRENPSSPAFDPEFERSDSADPICLTFSAILPSPRPSLSAENANTHAPAKTCRNNDRALLGNFRGTSKNTTDRRLAFSSCELVSSSGACAVTFSYLTSQVDGVNYIEQKSLSVSPASCGVAIGIESAASYSVYGATLTFRNPGEIDMIYRRE